MTYKTGGYRFQCIFAPRKRMQVFILQQPCCASLNNTRARIRIPANEDNVHKFKMDKTCLKNLSTIVYSIDAVVTLRPRYVFRRKVFQSFFHLTTFRAGQFFGQFSGLLVVVVR